jgi:hypothetical protein
MMIEDFGALGAVADGKIGPAGLCMLGSLFDTLFGCSHERTTFPVTPVDKSGATKGGTYVVCLECGSQFSYDWERMRIGKAVDISAGAAVANRETHRMPFSTKSKLRLALWASAVPAAWVIGKAIISRKRTDVRSSNDAKHR